MFQCPPPAIVSDTMSSGYLASTLPSVSPTLSVSASNSVLGNKSASGQAFPSSNVSQCLLAFTYGGCQEACRPVSRPPHNPLYHQVFRYLPMLECQPGCQPVPLPRQCPICRHMSRPASLLNGQPASRSEYRLTRQVVCH